MAPKSPWNNKTTVKDATEAAASPALDYGEVQTEEMDVLRAIYMEDFQEVAINRAWSKTTDRSFKLTLKPFTDLAKPDDFVVLSVLLTTTYPRSAPVLTLDGLQKFHDRTQKRVQNIVHNRPNQLLGEVMIYAISSEIQDALEDSVSARAQGTLPSLEDERANAEDQALMLAREAEEAEANRLREEQEEEDRVLKQMVNQEITRRDKRQSSKLYDGDQAKDLVDSVPDCVTFDQTAEILVENQWKKFTDIAIVAPLSDNASVKTYLGKPKIGSASHAPLVAVLRHQIERPRSEIIQLEAMLEVACKVRHSNVMSLFAYRVERINNFNSLLFICREYTEKGTLRELLSSSSLHLSKARQFTIQLLEGLDHLHSNGIGHGAISVASVYLSGISTLAPKLGDFCYGPLLDLRQHSMPPRWRSPEQDASTHASRRYSDIWDLGVVVVQMFLGLTAPNEYSSPNAVLSKLNLSDSFEDLLGAFFAGDARKRLSCFDLLPSEFLRTDAPVLQESLQAHQTHRPRKSSSGLASPFLRRSRHNSSNVHEPYSRYANDFTELGRLGKGGFGEVVKARNKLDGGIFAVKKIRQAPQLLGKVLSEVMLLNRLNHPYVVRYYNTWLEEDAPGMIQEEAMSTTEETESDGATIDFGYASTGGLDFVSSTGFPGIEFGEDDEDDDDESPSDDDIFERNSSVQNGTTGAESTDVSQVGLRLNKSRSDSQRPVSIMYIQMELCDRRSLRDLLRNGFADEEAWRYMRQITEGLAHIHGHGIIHRDLKPDNIFIDATGNPKIGDFGLATTGQYAGPVQQSGSKGQPGIDMTRSVGTALYVAPELQSASGTAYNEKVDMYSLGIMFFEMCQHFSTAMERINEINQVRRRAHQLPVAFHAEGEKAAQGRLIDWLISHKPSERPSSAELLRSDRLPVKIEDETIRQALNGLGDPRSPYHQQLMSALFAHDTAGSQRVKARVWETKCSASPDDPTRVRLRGVARSTLEAVFRRHGAEESRRDSVFPRSALYTNANVMQLLDASGNLLQLPYDLTLPYAHQLARQAANLRCTFSFGGAYRDTPSGGPPRVSEEADFDIVNVGRDEDVGMNDAEIIKAMDEVIAELPVFSTTASIVFLLNHCALLDAILDHCRVPATQQHAVKETLSKLGVHHWTWAKLRPELRNVGLSDTTLDDLQLFDWRDTPLKATDRLRDLLGTASVRTKAKAEDALLHLSTVASFVEKYSIACKLFVSPLSCVNAKFYEDGMLFQCLLEKKKNSFILAAGGRYDSLIRAHRMPETSVPKQGAVGLCIGIDVIVAHMSKNVKSGSKGAFLKEPSTHHHQQVDKRCEALVVANGTDKLRDVAMKLLTLLWANDISAELSKGHMASQEQDYSFIIVLRHETSTTVRITNTWHESEGSDVAIPSVVSHIQQELRERASSKARNPLLRNHSSHYEIERRGNNVQVLMARHGSKKSNKYGIVEAAQQRWSEKLDQIKGAPILAIEGRDEILNTIQSTRLGDGESWRKAIQSVQLSERQYIQEVKDMLEAWRTEWLSSNGAREVCIYNFRSANCIYYDLGL